MVVYKFTAEHAENSLSFYVISALSATSAVNVNDNF